MNTLTVKRTTDFQRLCGLSDFLSQCMRYPAQIHCCKQLNSDFYISQGSVATLLMCSGQNSSCWRKVVSWFCTPKIIKISQCFTELFKKISQFFETV